MKTTTMKVFAPMGALLALAVLGGQEKPRCSPTPPAVPDYQCTTAQDCEGLPHVMCVGEWECVQGVCEYSCGPTPAGCHSDADCPKGQHCSVSDGDCQHDPACPMCDVCYGECVPDQPKCIQSGCSGEVCASEPQFTPCLWQDWFVCLRFTTCGNFGPNGSCGFEPTPEYLDCLAKYKPCKSDADCPSGTACVNGACEPVPPPPGCQQDSDCPDGYFCKIEEVCPPCVDADPPPPCMMPCKLEGTCEPKPAGCKSDEDCAWYEYCLIPWVYAGSEDGKPMGCCPPNADCIPELPPCDLDGVCTLRPGYCWSDADCEPGERCEGVIPPCPEGANCFAAAQPGKCTPGSSCTPVRPGTHGACEMVLGYIFDGQQCMLESGCGCKPDCDFFFESLEECEAACNAPIPCHADEECPPGQVCIWSGGCPPCDCDPAAGDCACPMCVPPEHGYCGPGPAPCTSDADCDDGDKCTVDHCSNGECVHEVLIGCGWCERDQDGDGYFDFCNPADCDDTNPAVYPGAKEVCDGLDNDCDGLVDEEGCGAACKSDQDCMPYEYCSLAIPCCPPDKACIPENPPCGAGQCVLRPGYCWSDADCAAGEHCEGAIICPPGAYCIIANQPGKCVKDSYLPCTGNQDCPKGQVCDTSECLSCCADPTLPCIDLCCGRCVPAVECRSDADCPVGQYCALKFDSASGDLTGTCEPVPDGACVRDEDCGEGGFCEFGPCPLCFPCPCFGTCVYETHECKQHLDCPAGQECKTFCGNGWCENWCVDLPEGVCWYDKDCEEGEHCEGAIICPPGAMCLIADQPGKCTKNTYLPCTSSAECPEGQVCDTSQCLSCCPDLPPGEACIAMCCGQCVPAQKGCWSDADCPKGYFCNVVKCGDHKCPGPYECLPLEG